MQKSSVYPTSMDRPQLQQSSSFPASKITFPFAFDQLNSTQGAPFFGATVEQPQVQGHQGMINQDAAMAYDREAFRLRGENAKLNFPELFLNKEKPPVSSSQPPDSSAAAKSPSASTHDSLNPPAEKSESESPPQKEEDPEENLGVGSSVHLRS
ncbi:hypothetical protein Droror1_Dr00018023 [Drosera rotundifolia]